MSQYTGLAATQIRVLKHLEPVYPHWHNAEDVHQHLGLEVHSALAALQAREGLGLAGRFVPATMGETLETTNDHSTTRRL